MSCNNFYIEFSDWLLASDLHTYRPIHVEQVAIVTAGYLVRNNCLHIGCHGGFGLNSSRVSPWARAWIQFPGLTTL